MTFLTNAIATAVLLFVVKPLLGQCSMCQASLANAEGGHSLITGFQQGIGLLLLVMGALGVIGWNVARGIRRQFLSRDCEESKFHK